MRDESSRNLSNEISDFTRKRHLYKELNEIRLQRNVGNRYDEYD